MPKESIKKAVGLMSGGLDSTLSAKIIKDLGFEVHGIHFDMPWGTGKYSGAQKLAEMLGIRYVAIQLDDDYVEMLKNPRSGYGSAFNPCIDCHTYMVKKAGEYMKEIGAEFVFTGEVLGQRPMSQRRPGLNAVEARCGLKGRLLRPLSAKLMTPTIPEEEGIIDREKLYDITGRSRKRQIELAKEFGVTDYPAPAGGCLLTDKNFGRRTKDMLEHDYHNYKDMIPLQWGRHFRINEQFKVVLGRNAEENDSLKAYARPNDTILELENQRGPTAILRGIDPPEDVLAVPAGLIKNFSKYKETDTPPIEYRQMKSSEIKTIPPRKLSTDEIEEMTI